MNNQRKYDHEFKLNAVKLYRESGKSLGNSPYAKKPQRREKMNGNLLQINPDFSHFL
jgi:hypothetical protein